MLFRSSKRSSIISFASYCVCPDNPVTREQFKRVFRIYAEYEEIIKDNGLQNGEVDIAIRIIREAYENNLRNRSFVEDVRCYGAAVLTASEDFHLALKQNSRGTL